MAIAMILVPGALIALASGRRGFAAVGLAPALSVTAISLGGMAAGAVGAPWGWVPVMITAVALAALGWLASRLLARFASPRTHEPRGMVPVLRAEWPLWAGALIAAGLLIRHLRNILDRPDAFSQTFDNIFHLSLVRLMAVTDNGSAMAVGAGMNPSGEAAFYPAAFHSFASLGLVTFDVDIAVAVNAALIAIVAVAWPVGCLQLVRTFQVTPITMLGAGILTASFSAFPILLLEHGVLYPNLLGFALLPGVLAMVVDALGLGGNKAFDVTMLPLGAMALPGLIIAHPNALIALLGLATAPLLVRTMRQLAILVRTRALLGPGLIPVVLMVACLVAVPIAWNMALLDDLPWQPHLDVAHAVGETILNSPVGLWPLWTVSILMLIGLAAAWQRGNAWLIGSWVVACGLYVVASAFPMGETRDFFTGPFYNDAFRLAALPPVVALPLAALGLDAVIGWLMRHTTDLSALRTERAREIAVVTVGALAVAALVLGTQRTDAINYAIDRASARYALTPDALVLSTDELALLRRVPERIAPDSVVATTPWNGSSLLFAFTGVPTTTKHVFYEGTDELGVVNDRLNKAASDTEVCPALRNLHVRYALDFGPRELNQMDQPRYPGLTRLAKSNGFAEIDREGSAVLYEVTACD